SYANLPHCSSKIHGVGLAVLDSHQKDGKDFLGVCEGLWIKGESFYTLGKTSSLHLPQFLENSNYCICQSRQASVLRNLDLHQRKGQVCQIYLHCVEGCYLASFEGSIDFYSKCIEGVFGHHEAGI